MKLGSPCSDTLHKTRPKLLHYLIFTVDSDSIPGQGRRHFRPIASRNLPRDGGLSFDMSPFMLSETATSGYQYLNVILNMYEIEYLQVQVYTSTPVRLVSG